MAHDRKLLYTISGAELSGQVEEVSLNNASIYKKVNFNCNYLPRKFGKRFLVSLLMLKTIENLKNLLEHKRNFQVAVIY